MKKRLLLTLLITALCGCAAQPGETRPSTSQSTSPSGTVATEHAKATPSPPAGHATDHGASQPVQSSEPSTDISDYGCEWVIEPTLTYDDIQPIACIPEYSDFPDPPIDGYSGRHYLAYRQADKWGLMDSHGQPLTPADYVAIAEAETVHYLIRDMDNPGDADIHEGGFVVRPPHTDDISVTDYPVGGDFSGFFFWDEGTDSLMYASNEGIDGNSLGADERLVVRSGYEMGIATPYESERPLPKGGFGLAGGFGEPGDYAGSETRLILPPTYDDCMMMYSYDNEYDYFSAKYTQTDMGYLILKKQDKWGYMDQDGTELLPFQYDGQWQPTYGSEDVYPFDSSEGYIAVSKNGSAGYYDMDGKEAIPLIFEQTRPVCDGVAWVRKDGCWGLLKLPQLLEPYPEGKKEHEQYYYSLMEDNLYYIEMAFGDTRVCIDYHSYPHPEQDYYVLDVDLYQGENDPRTIQVEQDAFLPFWRDAIETMNANLHTYQPDGEVAIYATSTAGQVYGRWQVRGSNRQLLDLKQRCMELLGEE